MAMRPTFIRTRACIGRGAHWVWRLPWRERPPPGAGPFRNCAFPAAPGRTVQGDGSVTVHLKSVPDGIMFHSEGTVKGEEYGYYDKGVRFPNGRRIIVRFLRKTPVRSEDDPKQVRRDGPGR